MSIALKPYFCIVGRGDIPIFETDFSGLTRNGPNSDDFAPFVLYSCLDSLDQKLVSTNALFMKNIDKFNDMSISAYVTAGYAKFLLLHPLRMDESTLRAFFSAVHELYVKAIMNPFSDIHISLNSSGFDERVQAVAQRTVLVQK